VADGLLEREVAGEARLLLGRDGVHVRRVGGEGQVGARPARLLDELLDEEVRPVGPFPLEDALERLQSLARFLGIDVGVLVHGALGGAMPRYT